MKVEIKEEYKGMDYEEFLVYRWSSFALETIGDGENLTSVETFPIFPPRGTDEGRVTKKKHRKCRSCKKKKQLLKESKYEWKKLMKKALSDAERNDEPELPSSKDSDKISSSLVPSSKCRQSTHSDSSSSSGISDDLSSDSGSKSIAKGGGNSNNNGVLSETSDYQRSTPSPRDEGLYLEEVTSMSFQVHDEFVDVHLQKPDLGFEDFPPLSTPWPVSPNDRKTIYLHNQKLKVLSDFVYDPKIMFHRPEVILSPIKKEKKIKEECLLPYEFSEHHYRLHRKKRKKRKRGDFLPSSTFRMTNLIKPARLHFDTDSKAESLTNSKFSSLPGESNNPFLPICKKSSFLFGNEDEFDQAPASLRLMDDEIEEEIGQNFSPPSIQLRVFDEIAPSSDEEKLFQKSIIELQVSGESRNISTNTEAKLEEDIEEEELEEEEEEEEEEEGFVEEEEPSQVSSSTSSSIPHQIRFPSKNLHKGTIDCKWEDCKHSFISHGKLSDHLRLYHVETQFPESTFICLWEGCKVYGKRSCSQSWLEKHVPIHGGKYAFSCIVSGCKMRFSSEKLLQRHVNHHFNDRENASDQSSTIAKKILSENPSESSKNLKRAGVKLKYRRTVFSARIFDVFDVGVMAGIKASVLSLETNKRAYSVEEDWEDEGGDDVIKFTISSVKGFRRRINVEGVSVREALVTWSPGNILDDEWIEATGLKDLEKVVRLRELPIESRDALGSALLGNPKRMRPSRKRAKLLS